MSGGADATGTDPPLAVDIDGTLTDADRVVEPRVCPVLSDWAAPVVIATGKALPYPVALCEFLGLSRAVVAENGGVVVVGDEVVYHGDRTAAQGVADAFREAGHDLGWGSADFVNRWRETEVAVSRDAPLAPLERLASDHGLEVVDTGFAYHVKSTALDKGLGLETAAERLELDPGGFVAVGDSENDVGTFQVAGESFAVANADEAARAAADHVTEAAYADGFLEAVGAIRAGE